jgi:hypothetical protein
MLLQDRETPQSYRSIAEQVNEPIARCSRRDHAGYNEYDGVSSVGRLTRETRAIWRGAAGVKLYNQDRTQTVKRWELPLTAGVLALRYCLLPVHLLVRAVKALLRIPSPDVLLADGFLIGDAVLLRPLVKAVARTSGPVVYMGGRHVDTVFGDIDGLDTLHYQWPWAVYDFSARSWLRFARILWKLLLLTPATCAEVRGDFRSLAVLSALWCGRLVGFGFTGGHSLLDVDAAADGELRDRVVSLEAHNRALALALGLAYDSSWMAWETARPARRGESAIALSFSGSRPQKVLTVALAENLLDHLDAAVDPDLPRLQAAYLEGANDFFVRQPGAVDMLCRRGIRPVKGSFDDYFWTIARSSGYLGVDSAGGHIASIFDVPALVWFAPTPLNPAPVPSTYSRPIHHDVVVLESADEQAVGAACRDFVEMVVHARQ